MAKRPQSGEVDMHPDRKICMDSAARASQKHSGDVFCSIFTDRGIENEKRPQSGEVDMHYDRKICIQYAVRARQRQPGQSFPMVFCGPAAARTRLKTELGKASPARPPDFSKPTRLQTHTEK